VTKRKHSFDNRRNDISAKVVVEMYRQSDSNGYLGVYASFMNRTDMDEKYTEALMTIRTEQCLQFDGAKTCLAFGTGVGLKEIEFFRCFMPSLQSFTAVEPDAASVSELAVNLKSHLANVQCTVHCKTAEAFVRENGKSSKYDVVLFFHCLSYLNEVDRQIVFKTMFDDVLQPGGCIVVHHAHCRADGQEDVLLIANELKLGEPLPSADKLTEELLAVGFHLYHQHTYTTSHDFSDPDETLVTLFGILVRRAVSFDEFRTAVEKVMPSRKTDNNQNSILVFIKP
jgi:SAM-dependent methyltransferase